MSNEVNIRAKSPPDRIRTMAEASEAFIRVVQYSDAGSDAMTRYFQTNPGTATASKHHDRAEKYYDMRNRWSEVLATWFDERVAAEKAGQST